MNGSWHAQSRRLISLGILTTLIVALGITFYHVLAPFLLPLFLAWIVAIVCRPLYLWCVRRLNNRARLAAGFTTAGILVVVLLPFAIGTIFAAAQLLDLAQSTLSGRAEWRWRLDDLTHNEYVVELARRVEPYLAQIPVESDTPVALDEGVPVVIPPSPSIADQRPNTDVVSEPIELDPEVARERLHRRIDASVRATLKYVGARTLGIVSEVPGIALGVLGRIISLLVAIVMFGIGLYYFLCDGPELLATAETLIPVQSDYQHELLHRFNQVVRAVVLSTFLSALAQGLLTTFALGVAGFDHLMVFFLLSSLTAMIPLAGTWVVWGPCAIWLVIQGQSAAAADYPQHMSDAYWYWTAAVLLTLFGIVVIGLVDNVIRTYILNTSARLHPLLAFVSVLGGLQVMGLWGVFIGPIVAACLHALIQIFNTELKAFSNERLATSPAEMTRSDRPTPPANSEMNPSPKAGRTRSKSRRK